MSDEGFLGRWAQRKAQARRAAARRDDAPAGAGAADPAMPSGPAPPVPSALVRSAQAPVADRAADAAASGGAPLPAAGPQDGSAAAEALPALDSITPADDFSPFMRAGVEASTRNAALRTLFSDPHFNVMDGLDTYIDDYSKPSPMSAAMLRSLRQSQVLGLFDDEPNEPDAAAAGRPPDVPGASDAPWAEPPRAFDPPQDAAAGADMPADRPAGPTEADAQRAPVQAGGAAPGAGGPPDVDAQARALAGPSVRSEDGGAQEVGLARLRQIGVSLADQTAGPRAPDPGTIRDAVRGGLRPATGG